MSLLLALVLAAPAADVPRRPVHTYSIVARDAETGDLGVAVQSHWFGVGPLVAWAEAGVGAVATQSFVDPAYGPRGLSLLGLGMDAPTALSTLLSRDEGAAVRQVAMVDARGRVAVHTGERCIDFASHREGPGYSAQANMMAGEGVADAMAETFEASTGPLAERLVAALEAAQAVGGDVRGQQSAALLVVSGTDTGRPWVGGDVRVDLRVEDHPAPLVELRRLLGAWRAYEHMNAGDLAMEHGDSDGAAAAYAEAARLAPDNLEVAFWHAMTLATIGRVEESLPMFRDVFRRDPGWVTLARRLEKPGLAPPPEVLERILAEAPERHR